MTPLKSNPQESGAVYSRCHLGQSALRGCQNFIRSRYVPQYRLALTATPNKGGEFALWLCEKLHNP
jgi:hypothetical protein